MKKHFLNSNYNIFCNFLVAMLILLCSPLAFSDGSVFDDPTYKNSSLLQYESYISKYGPNPVDDCFSTSKVIWDTTELNQTYMPGIISSNTMAPPGGQGSATASTIATVATVAFVGLASSFVAGPFAILFLGIEILVMMDVCTNTYVIAPHEYFNQEIKNLSCSITNNIAAYTDSTALTSTDIPFFYHCNPLYDPIADTYLSTGSDADAAMIGRTYGYMGAASQYCTGSLAAYGDYAETNKLVSKIVVESAGGLFVRGGAGYNTDCTPDGKRSRHIFKAGESAYVFPAMEFAYYKLFTDTGKFKMCVASQGLLLTVRGACGSVAPPGDQGVVDPILLAYISDTRCAYLVQPRADLQSLGAELNDVDQSGISRKSVKLFLQSDFHFTSTVVGCLKDMLVKIFVQAPAGYGTYGETPFFQKVQQRLKQIVTAVLVLYVSLVGIKFMMSPEPPKRGDAIMMIVKFALVIYFAIGDAFYSVDAAGNVTGLFPSLIDTTDELANMFLEAQNANEPLGFCTYSYNGGNLLGENVYQSGNLTNTIGSSAGNNGGVKLTLWDLVDCKLINYLNMGSCDYTPGGMIVAWLVSTAFFVTGNGIILAIVSFTYCMLILLVIFKFAHIFILALITVTVLIFLSPIFIPFVLFEVTKGIYQKWLTTILGYLIYPALLFAFLAIMLATLDKIYYGDLVLGGTNGENFDLNTACQGVDSVYCYTMGNLVTNSNDACDLSPGTLANNYVTLKTIQYVGDKSTIKADFATGLLPLMLKLMLFAFLFYLFIGSVGQFLASLLGVQNIGEMAGGSINAVNALGAGLGAAKSGIGKVAGAIKGK